MITERLQVAVTYDPARGYVASASGLSKIEGLMVPDEVIVVLTLDRQVRLERDRRRAVTSGNLVRS